MNEVIQYLTFCAWILHSDINILLVEEFIKQIMLCHKTHEVRIVSEKMKMGVCLSECVPNVILTAPGNFILCDHLSQMDKTTTCTCASLLFPFVNLSNASTFDYLTSGKTF
jgi:hypothetical protein